MNISLILFSLLLACSSGTSGRGDQTRKPQPPRGGNPPQPPQPPTPPAQPPQPPINPTLPSDPSGEPVLQPAPPTSVYDTGELAKQLKRIEYNYKEFALKEDSDKYKLEWNKISLKKDGESYKYQDSALSIVFDPENRVMTIVIGNDKYTITMFEKEDGKYIVGYDYVIDKIFDEDIKNTYDALSKKEKIDTINKKIEIYISDPSFSSFDNVRTIHLFSSPMTGGDNRRASSIKNNSEKSKDTKFVNISLTDRMEELDNISFKNRGDSGINIKVVRDDTHSEQNEYNPDGEIGRGWGTALVSEAEGNEEDIKRNKTPFYYYVMKRKIEKESI